MKKIIFALTLLSSFSTFASDACTISISATKTSPNLEKEALIRAEEALGRKGFTASSSKRANFSLKFTATFIMTTRHAYGYHTGSVDLISTKKGPLVQRQFRDIGNASYLTDSSKHGKTLDRLEKAIEALPSCSELL